MRKTQAITITLPHDMIEMVKAKVLAGEYATESEVIRDGLRTLQARDAALEKWLLEEVVKSYDECAADETIGVPAEQVMARIRSQYHKRTTGE
ncbi:type II toxin-antitoxin system ParD family antitoxin [Aetokthonos hydrillicola Thurmond2011]|jgi:putative addiction module CopG family antidote|uniref:Type II toxin-antitoxin system ParD family antitoxin n=1 Tax=Aetokthonos hydrillicola Thurmond2011 TaxID=2712845 RepID=A0AAP5MDA3_9CYAN|nr:type II toxin-antitoxin system ParD family antitoxin [Aetokthonos hydrillicola]MBO3462847.1 type II toxin-antitoxin system ParD family antitoxin [Aetokthonos hydrillicola CCALA 1050]MBW4590986.1 type II toxin-antitoxin system ParD family antitoxin [Aetokthonos hydrillicola CCALA 1050]MDR9899044.1 type II toxin-antitoxin system ParD family antitoxin [Aetokthonos hydrillicola Thurmond2011]